MRGKHGSELNSMLIQKHEYTEQAGEIVQPRTHNVYATTLNVSRLPNLQQAIEKRPGSGDLIGIPSHYARLV